MFIRTSSELLTNQTSNSSTKYTEIENVMQFQKGIPVTELF